MRLLCVNNTNLHKPILHPFQDMADYWSNVRCQQGMFLFNALVWAEPSNSETRGIVIGCKAYSDILGVDHECDRQTNGRTDILLANAALYYVQKTYLFCVSVLSSELPARVPEID